MAETKGEWPAIGIDLGTTYSCVAVWRRDRVEIIVNDQGNRTTPSCVAFTYTDRLVGDAANNQCHTNPTNTIFGVKRLIGRKYRDSYVQSHIKLWPFTVEEERNGDKPEIVVQYQGERKRFSTEEISSIILAKMKSIAEAFLGTAVTNAVITVPAYFNDSQRRSTRDAARLAGLDALRVINEPTAAAVAYGLDNSGHRKNLLIFDLGGGTFDVSILRMEGSLLQVKATAGDTSLGGEDFDERMVKHLVGEFKKKHKEDVSGNRKAMRRMRTACEKAKRALSSTIDTFIELDYLHNGLDLTYRFTRAKFEELNMDMFEMCMDVVRKCLRDAKLQTGDVDEVVLVGGSTRIPKVQEMLRELFGGKEPCKSINPDEAVAYGAAVQAAKLAGAGQSKLSDLVLLDVIPLSLGTSTGDGEMSVIIPRNTPTPVKRMESYVTAHDNQPAVRVDVYEGERSMVADNNFLGEFIFGDLPRAPAGETTVTVAFAVDADGILSVSAENAETGKRQEVKISNESGRPTAAEVKRMLEEAERYRGDDEERRERAAARSRLGTYVANMRMRAREGRLGVKGTLAKVLEEKLEKASGWLRENQEAEAAEYERRRTKLELVFENVSSLSSLMGSLDLE